MEIVNASFVRHSTPRQHRVVLPDGTVAGLHAGSERRWLDARGGQPLGGPPGIAAGRAAVGSHHEDGAPHRSGAPLLRAVPPGAGPTGRGRARVGGTAATSVGPGACDAAHAL